MDGRGRIGPARRRASERSTYRECLCGNGGGALHKPHCLPLIAPVWMPWSKSGAIFASYWANSARVAYGIAPLIGRPFIYSVGVLFTPTWWPKAMVFATSLRGAADWMQRV